MRAMAESTLIEEYRAQTFENLDVLECREIMVQSLIINDGLSIDRVAQIGEAYGLFASDSAIVAADLLLNCFDSGDAFEC